MKFIVRNHDVYEAFNKRKKAEKLKRLREKKKQKQ